MMCTREKEHCKYVTPVFSKKMRASCFGDAYNSSSHHIYCIKILLEIRNRIIMFGNASFTVYNNELLSTVKWFF
jgi:hypothetical protein